MTDVYSDQFAIIRKVEEKTRWKSGIAINNAIAFLLES